MNSIPMTVAGLKEQFEQYQRAEDVFRANANEARKLLAEASRNRKLAYRKWQAKIEESKR